MRENINKKRKLVICTIILFFISLTVLMCYRLFLEKSYSKDYKTVGTVIKMDLEKDKWNLEIKYKDSEINEIVNKNQIYKDSDEYKKLEIYNVQVGSKIKIRTEEGFAEGFLGKRILYSTILAILED